MSTPPSFIPRPYHRPPAEGIATRARQFHALMSRRRSVRDFGSDPVPAEVIEDLVRTASKAPSGTNKQPWTFAAVSDPTLKHEICLAAEEEERRNYAGRMPVEWLQALEPIGTVEHKPFLETALWLIVRFRQDYGLSPDGSLVALTHTRRVRWAS